MKKVVVDEEEQMRVNETSLTKSMGLSNSLIYHNDKVKRQKVKMLQHIPKTFKRPTKVRCDTSHVGILNQKIEQPELFLSPREISEI